MRVTNNTNFNAVRDSIHKSKARMEKFQHESATLKKLNRPSDNPIASAKVMEIRTDKVNNAQFATNARMAEAFLNNTDHVLGDMAEIVLRAKEIALGQSSGASSTSETRLGVAEEVAQLLQRAVGLANTRIGDRFLFGGYKTDQPAVDGKGSYQGDDGQMMIEIAKDVFVAMNVPGIEAFNTNALKSADGRQLYGTDEDGDGTQADVQRSNFNEFDATPPVGDENVNLFDELQNFRIYLLTGDVEGIRSTLDRFDQLRDLLISTRAKVGSRVAGLNSAIQTAERHNLTNAELSQELEDADMASVMTNLAKEEAVLQGVLQTSQKLVQPSLMDFLR